MHTPLEVRGKYQVSLLRCHLPCFMRQGCSHLCKYTSLSDQWAQGNQILVSTSIVLNCMFHHTWFLTWNLQIRARAGLVISRQVFLTEFSPHPLKKFSYLNHPSLSLKLGLASTSPCSYPVLYITKHFHSYHFIEFSWIFWKLFIISIYLFGQNLRRE